MNVRMFLCFVLCIVCWGCHAQTSAPENLAAYKTTYEKRLAQFDSEAKARDLAALSAYRDQVSNLAARYQKAGNLEGWQAAAREAELFNSEQSIPFPAESQANPAFENLRKVARTSLDESARTRDRARQALARQYLQALDILKKNLTIQGDMGAALAVKQEVESVGRTMPEATAAFRGGSNPPGRSDLPVNNSGLKNYDLVRDFSKSVNPSGPWSYGWTPGKLGAFSLFGEKYQDANAEGWMMKQGTPLPQAWFNHSDKDHYRIRPGEVALHTGRSGQFCVLRWKAESRGRLNVAGSFGQGDRGSMTVCVIHNGKVLFEEATSSREEKFRMEFDVSSGDTLDFSVGPGDSGINNGSTPITAILTLQPMANSPQQNRRP